MAKFSSEILVQFVAEEYDSTPSELTLRAALFGGMYPDAQNPSGADVHYKGRIKSDVILDKRIGCQFWGEDSSLDLGYIDIAIEDQDEDIVDFASKVTIALVDIYQVNSFTNELSLITAARCSDIGFVNENTVRFRLESTLQGAFDAPINEKYFDDDLPLVGGKPWPIAWMNVPPGAGPEQLIPATLYDPTTLNYAINDTTLFVVDGVYDKGVKLLTPSQYTVTTNGIELKQNPEGRITVSGLRVRAPYSSFSVFSSINNYTRAGMDRVGIFANAEFAEITALHTELNMGVNFPQFFTQKVTSLKQFLDSIYSATGIWYYTDELSRVHFGRVRSPDNEMPVFSFDDSNIVGDIRVEDDKAPGLSASISHGESPGAYTEDELAGSVSSADRFAMINKSIETRTTKPIIPFYAKSETRDPLPLALSYLEHGQASGRTSVNKAGPYATFETKPFFSDIARVTSSYDTSAGIFNPTALKMVSNNPTEGVVHLDTSYPLTLTANQKWVVSMYVRIDPASSPRSTLNFRMFLETVAGVRTSGFVTVTPDNQYHRISFVADFTAISGTQFRVRLDNRAYDTADATMYVDGLQIELDDGSGQPTPFSDPVPSSTDLARTEVNRWFEELYPKRRRFYSFDVPMNDPQFNAGPPQLGAIMGLQSDTFKALDAPKNLLLRRIRNNYSRNTITLEGWG